MTTDVTAQVETVFQQAVALHRQSRLREAEVLYRQTLQLQPNRFDALHLLGIIALQENQAERAAALFSEALRVDPHNVAAHLNQGTAQYRLARYDAALASYDRVIALKPDYPEAHFSRGNALRGLKRNEEALASYDKALELKPDYADACLNRGLTLCDLNRLEAAITTFDRAIAIRPEHADAYYNCGNVLFGLRRYETALGYYDRALAVQPLLAGAHLNRGSTLVKLRRHAQAIGSYDKAITLHPDYAEAYFNRGGALQALGQHSAAVASYDRVIAINPSRGEAHNERGHALRALKYYESAIASYDKAMALRPTSATRGIRRHTKMQICDWADLEADVAQLRAAIDRGESVSVPFSIAALLDSPALQKKAARIWVREDCPPNPTLGALARHPRGERIRVGYFSADLHAHATAYLIAGLFEAHDRSRFHVTAFSFGPDPQDTIRQRLRAACEDFIDVRDKSDFEVATLARNSNIDIAIDLKGFTQDNRAGIFALRAAPLQVSYLGYPATMGADYIDYLVADHTLVPEANRQHYTEKIVYLPHSYQVNDDKRPIADNVFTRAELGLPEAGFVFCCFNNCYKFTPATFDLWTRILKRVEGSVLWLLEDTPAATRNLRREAEQRQVSSERLIFAKRVPLPEHLARQRAADLFLDTLPFNAHTTASDALWAGLPVLTWAGESFGARVAASLLTAIGLPELITTNARQYEQLAVHLAADARHLADLRQRLADNRLATPLFDTRLYTRHLETAYTRIFERYVAGMATDHIDLRPEQTGVRT